MHFLLNDIVTSFEMMDPAATTNEVVNTLLIGDFFSYHLEDRPGYWNVLLSNTLKPD